MVFEICWKPKAIEDLGRLEKSIQKRIVEKIESAAEKPERFLDWIRKYRVYRLRVGDFRVFVDLDNKRRIIEVLVIRHRNKAYRGWK